jgi:hypothetical protein
MCYCGIALKFFPPNRVPTGPPAPRQIVTKRNFYTHFPQQLWHQPNHNTL